VTPGSRWRDLPGKTFTIRIKCYRILSCARAAILLIAAGATAAPACAETLADAVAQAYQSNPTLLAQRAAVRETDETYVQARAGYEPTASVQASVTTEDDSLRNVVDGTRGVGAVQTSSTAITVTQPIYTGGRVARAVDAAEATVMAARETLRATEQTVLLNVVQAYMDVRRDQEALRVAHENVTLLERQLDEITARNRVGEVTRTDVAQTRERVSGARSQLAAAEAALGVSRAEYVQVIGGAPGDLAEPPALAALLPNAEEAAAQAAVVSNPVLRQADFTERASAAKLAEAKAQTRPTLALQGNLAWAGGSVGMGSPFERAGHDYSASAVVTFPITTGGMTSSQIRQAAEANAVDRIGIETARRQVLFQTTQAWRQLAGLEASVKEDQDQVDAARTAFEGSRQEGKLGLRSTLDVLIAEQDLYSAEVSLLGARHDAYVAASALLAAVGGLKAATLAPTVVHYDPAKNFTHVSRVPFWTPWEPAVAAVDRLAAPADPAPAGVAATPPSR
jgi:outer membrane protein